MPPPPRLHKPNATIILKNRSYLKNNSEILKEISISFSRLVDSNPLICNAFHFDQYSRIYICLNTVRFSAKISKTNLKFEKNH